MVSIGVPTELHASVFDQVLAQRPKAILLEKPIASTVAQATALVERAEASGCAVLVNYMRRFEPGVRELKRRLDAHELGDIYKATVWYAKGLSNNGSHFVKLLSFLLGPPSETTVLTKGRTHGASDHEPDCRVRFGATDAYLLAAREECFSIAEMVLMGTKGMVRYTDAGATIVVQGRGPTRFFPAIRCSSRRERA